MPPVVFRPGGDAGNVNDDAVIGSAALGRFNFILDCTHHKLYLKPDSHFYEAFE